MLLNPLYEQPLPGASHKHRRSQHDYAMTGADTQKHVCSFHVGDKATVAACVRRAIEASKQAHMNIITDYTQEAYLERVKIIFNL